MLIRNNSSSRIFIIISNIYLCILSCLRDATKVLFTKQALSCLYICLLVVYVHKNIYAGFFLNLKNGEEKMIHCASWNLAKDTLPNNITISVSGEVWVAESESSVIQLSPPDQKIQIELKSKYDKYEVIFVEPKNNNRLWLILTDENGVNRLAILNIENNDMHFIDLTKEPSQLGWIEKRKELWYIATDLSLNLYKNEKNLIIDDSAKFNSLLVSDNYIIRRNSQSMEIEVSSLENIKWKRYLKEFNDKLVGFVDNNVLLMLKLQVWKKGLIKPPDSIIFSKTMNGLEKELLRGQIVMAVKKGAFLSTVTLDKAGKCIVNLYKLKQN